LLEESLNKEDYDSFISENNRLQDINMELERKLKESLKAI